jgi:5-(carboxyamino)imidazole ribonucleotide synthase
MFAIAARQMGYGVHVFSPEAVTPAGQVADREWTASYDDLDRLTAFAQHVDAVTLEFENVPLLALNHLERFVPVRPGPRVLEAAQNRLKEKRTLREKGLPTADFAAIHSQEELTRALEQFGGRGVLKTASWGYDGKGQQTLNSRSDLSLVWKSFSGSAKPASAIADADSQNTSPQAAPAPAEQTAGRDSLSEAILESFVDFSRELSIIVVRSPQGEICCYAPILNAHDNHILDVSVVPAADFPRAVIQQAQEIAIEVMRSLDVVGVLCVEMFLTQTGDLLINEIAPRPHNSGHLTIEAHATSQFEQQVRSICGLPLGSTRLRKPAAMANLLGHVWKESRQPCWPAVLKHPEVHLHLYGKAEARPGRKMGHLTALAESASEAEHLVRAARRELIEHSP